MITCHRGLKFPQYIFSFILVVLLTGCAPDLIVKDVVWNDAEKNGKAVITNIGNEATKHEFQVYFDADESPVSLNHRPQISKTVAPPFGPGQAITYQVDFTPQAHVDNNNLGNFHSITVRVDPKNEVAESNENNNVMNSLGSARSNFVCDVTSGGLGIKASDGSTGGSIGLQGSAIAFQVINMGASNMGQIYFGDFTAAIIYPGPSFIPASLNNAKVQLLHGRGSYDFATGNFANLIFDVLVTDASGNTISNAAHNFSGNTSAPLTIPVGSTQFNGVNVQFKLVDYYTIDLGSGYIGQLHIDTCPLASAVDVP